MTNEYKNKEIKESRENAPKKHPELGKCPICGSVMHEITTQKGTWYICENNKKNSENSCSGIFGKNMKYFEQTISVPIEKAKKLLNGEAVPFKLKAKDGHLYEAPMVLKTTTSKTNGKTYINLYRSK